MPRNTPPSQNPAADGPASGQSFEALAAQMLDSALSLRADGKPLVDPAMEECISAVCAQARANQLPVERLVIDLKACWFASPRSTSFQDKNDVVPTLVSLCIREYFRDGGVQK